MGAQTYKRKDDFDLKKRYDPEPLLRFIERRAIEHANATQGIHAPWSKGATGYAWIRFVFGEKSNFERQLSRWRKGETLSWWYADKIAGMLGAHPAWIWPDWYEGVPEVEDLVEEEMAA